MQTFTEGHRRYAEQIHEAEFNEFKPRRRTYNHQFKLRPGSNFETMIKISSKTNHVCQDFNKSNYYTYPGFKSQITDSKLKINEE